jgi:glycosyltransferase involved in cell wall biosynthesis
MLPEIRAVVSDFTVHVCYGFYNWEEACKKRNDQDGLKLIKLLMEKMEQPGVVYHGRLPKKELAKLQLQAKVWLNPTWFSETFCISAIENAAAGNALITTDYAGLQISAAGGILLPLESGMSRDGVLPESYRSKFLAETIKCLTDDAYRAIVAQRSLEATDKFRWSTIVDGWIERTGLNT